MSLRWTALFIQKSINLKYTKLVATFFIKSLNDALKCLAEYKIDNNWICGLTNMLNNLIEYRKNVISPPIALSLLAFFFEYNNLTNDQIDRFETYLGQLREISNKICINLEKNKQKTLLILQGHLKNFVIFLKEINDLLETQLEELNNKKDSETFKAARYAIGYKYASAIYSGVFGGTALQTSENYYKDSQEFLNVVQKYVDDVKLTDLEIPFIIYQLKTFN
ncbi:hypothetical protein C1646_708699, partial [Rhizophagus diaphanus]